MSCGHLRRKGSKHPESNGGPPRRLPDDLQTGFKGCKYYIIHLEYQGQPPPPTRPPPHGTSLFRVHFYSEQACTHRACMWNGSEFKFRPVYDSIPRQSTQPIQTRNRKCQFLNGLLGCIYNVVVTVEWISGFAEVRLKLLGPVWTRPISYCPMLARGSHTVSSSPRSPDLRWQAHRHPWLQ